MLRSLQVVQMDLLYLSQLQVLKLSVMFGASQLANPFAFVLKLHNVFYSASNSVAPLLTVYKQHATLNSLIRSDSGLTLGETPGLESLYDGQITLLTHLIKPKIRFLFPTDGATQFPYELIPLSTRTNQSVAISQTVSQTDSQSVSQSVSQSINQLVSLSVCQSFCLSLSQSANQFFFLPSFLPCLIS